MGAGRGRAGHGRLTAASTAGATAEVDNGERDMRRRLVVGGALNHGADIGRWRTRADPALLFAQNR
ncbi:hypothetical protein [Nocardiopsis metallicus]|uniref:Uncharacterized protein n=1 Tax=Nocardiopsis metallicus TaxID=179819 RepID=A0A840WJI7_9ACTN|nr:hypothetical protein [Nocardiopsis metallicus]MBB5491746.1 hypothetical protein [Nocardiopsis metallicus]